MDAIEALQAALAAENAAIYGYGIAGAVLSGADRARAVNDWTSHRDARDTLEAMIAKLGTTPVPAKAAYDLPFPVPNAAAARRLAVAMEDGVTRAYLGLVAVTDPTLRTFGALAMQPPAQRAAAWRGSTVAFPGMPSGGTTASLVSPSSVAARSVAARSVAARSVAARQREHARDRGGRTL